MSEQSTLIDKRTFLWLYDSKITIYWTREISMHLDLQHILRNNLKRHHRDSESSDQSVERWKKQQLEFNN